jgi:hypothetical protein
MNNWVNNSPKNWGMEMGYLHIYLPTNLPIYRSIFLSIYQPNFLSIYLCVRIILSTYLSIYLFADVDFPLVGSWSSEEIDSCILVKQVPKFAAHLHPKMEKHVAFLVLSLLPVFVASWCWIIFVTLLSLHYCLWYYCYCTLISTPNSQFSNSIIIVISLYQWC